MLKDSVMWTNTGSFTLLQHTSCVPPPCVKHDREWCLADTKCPIRVRRTSGPVHIACSLTKTVKIPATIEPYFCVWGGGEGGRWDCKPNSILMNKVIADVGDDYYERQNREMMWWRVGHLPLGGGLCHIKQSGKAPLRRWHLSWVLENEHDKPKDG